nr:MAG TPA: hypothetical protein [Caudoviricetes sp.]
MKRCLGEFPAYYTPMRPLVIYLRDGTFSSFTLWEYITQH